mgnify:CR=1 FL=1
MATCDVTRRSVATPVTAFAGTIWAMTQGAVLGLAYFSPLREEYR